MDKIKIEHCLLAARICSGLLVLFFFLPWISISFFGITESVNGWGLAFGSDGYLVIFTLLLFPLGVLAVSFLKDKFLPDPKQAYLILACLAAVGLLFLFISHGSLGSFVTAFSTFIYTLNFVLHIALTLICGFAFWLTRSGGVGLPNFPGIDGAQGNDAPAQSSSKFCNNCGTSNEGAEKFCSNCGHDMTS